MKTPVRWHYGSTTDSWMPLGSVYPVSSLSCSAQEGPSPPASGDKQEEVFAVRVVQRTPEPRCSQILRPYGRQQAACRNNVYAVRQVIERQTLKLGQVRAIPPAARWAIDWVCLDPGVDYFSSAPLLLCAFLFLRVCRMKFSINHLQTVLINLVPPRLWFIELVLWNAVL